MKKQKRNLKNKCYVCDKIKKFPLVIGYKDGKKYNVCSPLCEIKYLKKNKKYYIKTYSIENYNFTLNLTKQHLMSYFTENIIYKKPMPIGLKKYLKTKAVEYVSEEIENDKNESYG
tara:strand:- start:1012 stop:1359 length:348 start_codon:yes stop_codon:yes gene_type:complete